MTGHQTLIMAMTLPRTTMISSEVLGARQL